MTEIDPRDPRYQQQYPPVYGQQQGAPVYATPVYGGQQQYGQQQYGQQQYATPIYAQQAPGDQQYVQSGYASDAGAAEKGRRTSVDPLTSGGGGGGGASKDGRFEYADGQYRDLCWLVLFVVHLIAMIVVAGVYGKDFVRDLKDEEVTTDSSTMSKSDQRTCIAIIVVSAIVGAVFGAVWLGVMKRCADSIIKISMVLSTAILILAIIVSIAQGAVVMAVIYIIILILQSIYFFLVRNRIPFAQATLGASVQAVQDHSGPVYVTYLMAVVSIIWTLFWAFTFISIFHATQVNNGNAQGSENSRSNGINGLAYFALLVSLYWTTEVIKNIAHVTTAGVVATWWFNPMATSGVTCGAFKRATTTSLGSICFGSLIVAVLQATRQILREAMRQAQSNGNAAAAFLACCFECLLSWIESMIRYFNMYAYTRVAIYGVDFITAAKETWQLFTNRGFEMLINDDLTGMVLMMGCFVGAVITGLIGAFWAKMLNFNEWVVLGVIAFVIGYIMVALIMNVIESAVATTYVVWAEDPALCNQARPEHYTKLRDAAQRAYPSGQW